MLNRISENRLIGRVGTQGELLCYSCRQVMKTDQVLGVMLSNTERCVIDHAHLQNHRQKENCIPTASESFGVCVSVKLRPYGAIQIQLLLFLYFC